jgi:hypothetical protein
METPTFQRETRIIARFVSESELEKVEMSPQVCGELVRISFPPDIYESLEELAKKKTVSLAWVVRDAAERYIADRSAEVDGVIEKRMSRKKRTNR